MNDRGQVAGDPLIIVHVLILVLTVYVGGRASGLIKAADPRGVEAFCGCGVATSATAPVAMITIAAVLAVTLVAVAYVRGETHG